MLLLILASLAFVSLDDLITRWRDLRGGGRALGVAGLVVITIGLVLLCPERPVLEKLAGRLVMPAGLLFVIGWGGSLLAWKRRPRLGAALFAIWLFYSFIGNDVVGGFLLRRLEAPYRSIEPLRVEASGEVPPFDAVFVLGGGVAITESGESELAGSGDRVILAARMYHAGLTERLVTSGRSVPGMGHVFESGPVTARLWRSIGVPGDAILVIDGAYNTGMEIARYAELTRARGFERVGLVTSAWHMRRAMRLAERIGFEIEPLPADRRGGGSYDGLVSLIPTGGGFGAVHRAAWEWVGSAAGH
jgi:uncharacterized SAM-binding protein YcdF (DUF218 family)